MYGESLAIARRLIETMAASRAREAPPIISMAADTRSAVESALTISRRSRRFIEARDSSAGGMPLLALRLKYGGGACWRRCRAGAFQRRRECRQSPA